MKPITPTHLQRQEKISHLLTRRPLLGSGDFYVPAGKLDSFRTTFDAGAPPEIAEVLARADREIAASGIAARTIRAGDIAPDFSLVDTNGAAISLARSRVTGPVVLSFYRGDWCPYCNIELEALAAVHPDVLGMNAKVVAVSPQKAGSRQPLPFPLLYDAGSKVARAYGPSYELPTLLRPLFEMMGHALPVVNESDDWSLPLPATYVVGSDGRIALSFVDADHKQRIEPSEILAALACLRQHGAR